MPLRNLLRQLLADSRGTLGRTLIRSSLGVSGILAVDVCLGVATAILLARSLGVAGLGIYSVGLATGRMLSALLQVGLPNLLTREVNHGHARTDMGMIRGVVWFTFAILGGLSAAFAVTAYLAWPLIAARLPESYVPAILAGLFFAPAVAGTNICSGGLQGWHKVRSAAATTTALTSGGMLAMVVAALALQPGWLTPGRAVALNVAAQGVAFALTAALFFAWTLPRVRGAVPSYSLAGWRRSMARFTAVGGLMMAEQQMLTFALGALASETQVGLFRMAQRAASLAVLLPMAIDRVLAPHIGQSHARGEKARLQKLVTRGAQAMGGAAFAVFLGFIVLGEALLDFVVGAEFLPAYLPLVILSFGFFLRASFGPSDVLMNMTGQEGAIVWARIVAMAVTLGVTVALMGDDAAIGAAIANTLGMLVMGLILWRAARRRLDCRTSAFGL